MTVTTKETAMRTSMLAATLCALMTAIPGCDDPDARDDLLALAAEEQDPEIRAELDALADEADADDVDDAEDAEDAEAHADELSADLDPAAGTCFFCPPPPAPDPNQTAPIIKSPYVQVNQQGNAILYMAAAGSYIASGATVKLQVPYSVTTYGPFALQFDVSGTQFRANVNGFFPVGSCRMITVTNPNNQTSSPVSLCR